MQIYKRIAAWLVAGLLFIWIILTPSHFQKGGVTEEFYFEIAGFVILLSAIISMKIEKFHPAEKLTIAIIFGLISLFVTSIFIIPLFIEGLYNDKTWFFWETPHRLIINSIYYCLNVLLLTVAIRYYFKLRTNARQRNISYKS